MISFEEIKIFKLDSLLHSEQKYFSLWCRVCSHFAFTVHVAGL